MRQHAGQNGTKIHTILVGRLMLLRSKVLVDQCHLAAASSHRAAASLAAVSLIHKGTDRSITSAIAIANVATPTKLKYGL